MLRERWGWQRRMKSNAVTCRSRHLKPRYTFKTMHRSRQAGFVAAVIEGLLGRRISGALKPPSSRSSPFCGHKIFFVPMACAMARNTRSQTMISPHVATQPTMLMAGEPNALPMAKVAVIKAVLGKTKLNQVMPNWSEPRPRHCQLFDQRSKAR